jgi:ABC-2 type transport system permease protein
VRKVLDVAVREFRATVLTKAFLIAAVILPVVIWTMGVVMPLMLHAPPKPLVGKLAVVDSGGRIAEAVAREFDSKRLAAARERELEELRALLAPALPPAIRDTMQSQIDRLVESPLPQVELEIVAEAAASDALKERARSGELLACAVFAPAVLGLERETNSFELYSGEDVTRQHLEDLRDALQRGVVAARAAAHGLDLELARATLAEPTAVATTMTRKGGEAKDNEIAKLFVPLAFMLLLWTSTWMTGNYLLTSTVEEKSNRVIEVLLSAVSPLELLSGKILGQCAVGLVMIALYGGVGVTAVANFGYSHLVPPEKLAFLGLYFLMAFFMVASTMAAIGSAVNELREAQTLLGPVTVIFMVPLFSWFFISENPNSTFAIVVSFVPPMTPFAMILRVTAVESVPLWQLLATTVVGFAGVAAMVWAAARIFRVGVLMTGKPPSPGELLKWIRYA